MMITAREKAIIELLVKRSHVHSIASIAEHLRVSTRTIQRDLKNVEKVLAQFDLTIESDKGLAIKGKNQNIYRLIQKLVQVTPADLSLEERRLLAYIQLFDATEPVKLTPLANDLGISVTTLSADLDDLAKWLQNHDVTLVRKKGVGVELEGREESKRKAFVSYLMIHFKDELIDQLFLLSSDQVHADKILFYFEKDYLKALDNIVYETLERIDLQLVDSDYITFLIQICLSMQRVEKGFFLSEDIQANDLLKNSEEYNILNKIASYLHDTFSINIGEGEIIYLTTFLRGSKLVKPKNTYYDRVHISRSIKKLIRHVSEQLHVDLTSDFSLFQGLMAHMEPTIYRQQKGLPTYNPLTKEIKEKYPLLFMAVQLSLAKAFPHLSFTDDEVAYVVLHFGSALELKKENVQIRALIICPTGIGTSKMLSSRIKREIPEITYTHAVSLREIKQIDWHDYQIIISTVLIPFQVDFEYVYVNPLLYEEDIEAIREYLREHIQEITKDKTYEFVLKQEKKKEEARKYRTLETLMQEIDICQNTIRTLLRNFSVMRMNHEPTYDVVIQKMLAYEVENMTVTDAHAVYHELKRRETKGGLGIPGTDMALFHCRHPDVKEMSFRIAHLDSPYKLTGMDMSPMHVRNILLLLAPETLNNLQLEILSLVSTIIVENQETIMLFSSADEQMIRQKLERAFLDFLQSKFGKD